MATSEKYRRRLYKEIELVHKLGITGISLIDSHELRQRVDSPLYVGGAWWEPNCGILNPAKLAWSWRDAVAGKGVEIYERTPVETVEPEADGVSVAHHARRPGQGAQGGVRRQRLVAPVRPAQGTSRCRSGPTS